MFGDFFQSGSEADIERGRAYRKIRHKNCGKTYKVTYKIINSRSKHNFFSQLTWSDFSSRINKYTKYLAGNLSAVDVGTKSQEKEHELLQQDGGSREQKRSVSLFTPLHH